MKQAIVFFMLLTGFFLAAQEAAAEVNIPYEFKAGQVARASEINANFTALKEAIESLQAQNSLLEEENRTLKEKIAELQAQIEALGKPGSSLAEEEEPVSAKLRTEPLIVSEDESNEVFGLDDNRRPRTYTANNFEDRVNAVIDHTTGLMWQKSGSDESLTYKEAQAYIEQLNQTSYGNWRLPTIPELMSLLEPEKQSNNLYINPIFDARQLWIWSADPRRTKDKSSPESAWSVGFHLGRVGWTVLDISYYVRAVRSWQ